MTKLSVARVGDRGMREHELTRRKCARVRFRHARAVAEKSDLDAEAVAARVLNPSGDVPPFAAKRGVSACVFRKLQRMARYNARVFIRRNDAGRQEQDGAREKPPSPHAFPLAGRSTITNPPSPPARPACPWPDGRWRAP